MVYIFDTNTFIVLGHYFPDRFPSFWKKFETFVEGEGIISVREVLKELDTTASRPHLREWVEGHKNIFHIPGSKETEFLKRIFSVPRFQHLVDQKKRLKGTPVADPFVIASAKIHGGYVVTEEDKKKDASRIPNVCEYFEVNCTNLEGFMKREGWQF